MQELRKYVIITLKFFLGEMQITLGTQIRYARQSTSARPAHLSQLRTARLSFLDTFLEYGCEVRHLVNKQLINRLKVFQNKVLCYIFTAKVVLYLSMTKE